MKILKMILKNAFRHKLRTLLTIFGISIAVIAFGLLPDGCICVVCRCGSICSGSINYPECRFLYYAVEFILSR